MLGTTTFAALLGGLVGGRHCGMQGRELAHHALVSVLLIGVNGLGMLAEVVEARKLLSAVTGERTFAGMLPVREDGRRGTGWMEGGGGKPGTGRGTNGGRARNTDLMCLARCSLLLKTMRQSP